MMITEGKKKRKRKGGDVSARQRSPPHGIHVGWTWSTVLGTGHLITAGKLEELGTAVSMIKGLLGLTWGERLKD